jgi:hypothetical protein
MTDDWRTRFNRVEGLIHQIEASADAPIKVAARELAGALLELHGEGLERLVELVKNGASLEALTSDELVANLLLLHGLHPEPLENRIEHALSNARRDLGVVVSASVDHGQVRVRFSGAHPQAKMAALEIIHRSAPDASAIEVDADEGLVQLGLPSKGRERVAP